MSNSGRVFISLGQPIKNMLHSLPSESETNLVVFLEWNHKNHIFYIQGLPSMSGALPEVELPVPQCLAQQWLKAQDWHLFSKSGPTLSMHQ